MHPQTNTETMPVYGARPSKPGLYLGLFHGRDTPNQAMHGWGFDGPGSRAFLIWKFENLKGF